MIHLIKNRDFAPITVISEYIQPTKHTNTVMVLVLNAYFDSINPKAPKMVLKKAKKNDKTFIIQIKCFVDFFASK